ncbi:MAG: tetratricopeptide repeat protein, partial [Bacteroidota bacterium]|nr:tetratricopeptide repeat protein [Bacteroidota bacterium]
FPVVPDAAAQDAAQRFYLRVDSARSLLAHDPPAAVAAAQRAAREAEDDAQRLEAEEIRAEALHRAGANAAALSAYELALVIAGRSGDAQARGRLLNRSGNVYRTVGRYDRSLALHLEALAVFDSLGNDLGRAQAMHDLAETLLQLGQTGEARRNLDRALRLRRGEEHREGIAESFIALGNLYRQIGEADSALESFKQALAQQKLIGLHSTPVARSLGSIGDILRQQGDVPGALESFREALGIAEAAGNSNVIAEIRMDIGICYRMLGDLARARSYIGDAGEMARSGGRGLVLADALAEAARVEEQAGAYARALALFRESVAVRDSTEALLDRQRLADAEELYRRERSGMEFQDFEESRAQDLMVFLLVVTALLLLVAASALYVLRLKARGNRELSEKNREIQLMNDQLQTLNRELAQSEEKYRLLFERLPLGVFVYDSNLQLIQVNDAFAEILGSSRERLEGLMMRELRDRRIIPALESAIEGETGSYEGEYGATTSEKIIDVSMRTAPLAWNDGGARYGLGFVLDITNWKRIERELIEAKEMAEMADGMKHAFLTSISHEIRTPLNIIMGYFGILQADLRDSIGSDEMEHFAKVDLAVRRLLRTVDQILNLSILESGTYSISTETCPLYDMIMELVEEMRPLAVDKGLKVELHASCEDVAVLIDRYSIAQALRNLLDNAVKFTDEGSIRVSLDCRGNMAAVHIEDSGIGMSDEYIQRLYQSFSQEEGGYTRSYDGLGLGLTLTKRYVDVNGGGIEVKSRKGLGTTFTVRLPIAVPLPPRGNGSPGDASAREDGRGGAQPHVLVVEDDHETQKFLQLILNTHCTLSFADTAVEAWDILERGGVDIVLMDISLRGDEDGLQLTRRIRENPAHADLPIVAVTAHAFADDRRRSLEAGCNEYLPKPFRMKQLRELIARFTPFTIP